MSDGSNPTAFFNRAHFVRGVQTLATFFCMRGMLDRALFLSSQGPQALAFPPLGSTVRERSVVRPLVAMTFFLGATCVAAAAEPCAIHDHSKIYSPDRKPLPPAAFAAVRLEMTMLEIVELLGPAQRELGSGLLILGWKSGDGRLFLVGGPSMCQPPLYARFDPLELTREK